MMKLTMAVWTGGDGIVHGIRAALGERSDVMNFKEWIAVRPTEWCWVIAHLTGPVRRIDNPVDYPLVPHETKCGFFDLQTSR
jgi:hypothetical protein